MSMITIGTCKECRHWSPVSQRGFVAGECTTSLMPDAGSHDCVYLWRGQRALLTGPDFGCIHWTAKRSPTT